MPVAGFASLHAARYLDKTVARRGEAEVVLISRTNFILFTPMLHEVAREICTPVTSSIRCVEFFVTLRSSKAMRSE